MIFMFLYVFVTVYATLEGEGIEIPRYAVLDRDSPDPKREFLFPHKSPSN